jgi:hypothetical protein
MSDEKQLTVRHESALDVYGSGDDIKTLAQRIKLCLPGGAKLSDNQALSLAQLSVAYELNPFNGEVWYIPERGTMVGIKGLRKSARKQGNYWPTFDILGKTDKQALGIPENAIAYRCNIYRTDLLRQSAEAIDLLRSAGMVNAWEVYAYKPAEGIGYCNPGESTKMKPDQAARKRAEADALKVAFDLPFASEVGNGNTVGYVDAEWSDVTDRKHGPEWPPEIAPEEDEPVIVFSDIPPEPPASTYTGPTEPSRFFGEVNKATGFYYRAIQSLANSIKEETGRSAWPATKDTAGWSECWDAALKHAKDKNGEGKSDPAPVEQPPLVDAEGDLLP